MELSARVRSLRLSSSEIETRTATIRREVLSRSPHVREANFARIGPGDLELLFELYDRTFFSGALSGALGADRGTRLRFRLSQRMTSAGGKTFHYLPRGRGRPSTYEIAISTHLLFLNFGEAFSPIQVKVNGRVCRSRLEALQRVFEHELAHLIELLLTGRSSCRAKPFQELTRRLFGHTDVTHRMVTGREKALKDHGLRPGDRVAFSAHATRRVGVINRITKRATVLVEDDGGVRYTDGKTYLKFYVPLGLLERLWGPDEGSR